MRGRGAVRARFLGPKRGSLSDTTLHEPIRWLCYEKTPKRKKHQGDTTEAGRLSLVRIDEQLFGARRGRRRRRQQPRLHRHEDGWRRCDSGGPAFRYGRSKTDERAALQRWRCDSGGGPCFSMDICYRNKSPLCGSRKTGNSPPAPCPAPPGNGSSAPVKNMVKKQFKLDELDS